MSSRILFDLSGFLQWYAYLRHPSGLQRVCERILQSRTIAESPDIVLMARAPGGDAFHRVDLGLVIDLARPDRRAAAIGSLRELFADLLRRARPSLLRQDLKLMHLPYLAIGWARPWRELPEKVRPEAGDVIVGLGDFWCHRGHVAALLRLKGQARLVHMLHDLFVLDHPEWSHPYFGRLFAERLPLLAAQVDRWLVNSRFVGRSLATFAAPLTPPIDLVPMGWDPPGAGNRATLGHYRLEAAGYVLHVGTLEPRKNLVALIDAVERVPAIWPLVLVGRDGWRSNEIRARIGRAGDRIVRWIPDVPDHDLPAFYCGARFTIVPSLGEGWGLSVQESLAQGVPCIAARAGGLPEIGGDLVRYVEPGDVDGLAAAIDAWAANGDELEAARTAIARRAGDPRPSWEDAAAQVLQSALSARS